MNMRHFVLAVLAAGTAAPLIGGWRRFGWAWPVAHGAAVIPSVWRNGAFFGPVAKRFRPSGNEVWITVDDGPDPRDTPEILRLLDRYGGRAGFFFIGRKVEAHRALAHEVHAAGHAVGNHTHSHPQAGFWALPPRAMRREIARANHALQCATGARPRFFRAPVGMVNPFVHPELDRIGLRAVGWTRSGVDGLSARGETVARRVLENVRPGDILALHEGGAPGRVETFELVLKGLDERGLRSAVPPAEALR